MPVTSSDVIVLALATAAPLDSSLVAQTKRATMTRFAQLSNKLLLSNEFLGQPFASDNHSFPFLMNNLQKKLGKWKEELEKKNYKNAICWIIFRG